MRGFSKLAIAIVCAGAVFVGFGSGATASSSGSSSATSLAKQCAGDKPIKKKLRAQDLQTARNFTVCLGKQWPGTGGFNSLGGMTSVAKVFGSFARAPKSKAKPRYIASRLEAAKYRRGGKTYTLGQSCFWYAYGDTTAEGLSLGDIAHWVQVAHKGIIKSIGAQGNFLPTTAIVQRGAWFSQGSQRNNLRFAVVFAGNSVEARPHC